MRRRRRCQPPGRSHCRGLQNRGIRATWFCSPIIRRTEVSMKPTEPRREAQRYTVVVRGLVLWCSIGIKRAEREHPQRVRISVELTAIDDAAYPGEERRRVVNY